jgi:hypothetical protein
MNKLALRIASLSLAVVVTGFLVARSAGCTSAKVEPVSPTSTPPPVVPTDTPPFPAPSATPSDAGPATVDAGPQANMPDFSNPAFLPATKSAMPIMRPQKNAEAPAKEPAQQATP